MKYERRYMREEMFEQIGKRASQFYNNCERGGNTIIRNETENQSSSHITDNNIRNTIENVNGWYYLPTYI